MAVYHVEFKEKGSVFQFVSGNITQKAMFKWVYEQMKSNSGSVATIYTPTQRIGTFNLYNKLGSVKVIKNGVKFYQYYGSGEIATVKSNGDLDWASAKETKRRN